MPAKARRSKTRAHRITTIAVEAFQQAREARGRCRCEDVGVGERCGACLTYLEAAQTLRMELGIRPWQVSPLDVEGPTPPVSEPVASPYRDSWPLAWELRQEMERP